MFSLGDTDRHTMLVEDCAPLLFRTEACIMVSSINSTSCWLSLCFPNPRWQFWRVIRVVYAIIMLRACMRAMPCHAKRWAINWAGLYLHRQEMEILVRAARMRRRIADNIMVSRKGEGGRRNTTPLVNWCADDDGREIAGCWWVVVSPRASALDAG